MAKVPIHFIGFLANVNDSIIEARTGRWIRDRDGTLQSEVMRISRARRGTSQRMGLARCGLDPCLGSSRAVLLLRQAGRITQFECHLTGGCIRSSQYDEWAHTSSKNKLPSPEAVQGGQHRSRLLVSILRRMTHEQVNSLRAPYETYPVADSTPFTLTTTESPEARSFHLTATSLPLLRDASSDWLSRALK